MSRTFYCLAFYVNIEFLEKEIIKSDTPAISKMFNFIKNTIGGVVTLFLTGKNLF
jgi:hypothetical protein